MRSEANLEKLKVTHIALGGNLKVIVHPFGNYASSLPAEIRKLTASPKKY